MKWFEGFKNRRRAEAAPSYRNEPAELLDGDFFVMFLPVRGLFGGADSYRLTYSHSSLFKNELCRKEAYRYESFDTAYYLKRLQEGRFLVIELGDLGSLVFTNHRASDLFQILQSHYRNCTSYVFCATDSAGYFKKLRDGKISRKIASHLVAEGIGNYPEIRGTPCEFELETGRVFKLDPRAHRLDELLKGFGKREILSLMDYYVGLSNLQNENISNVAIYHAEENPNG